MGVAIVIPENWDVEVLAKWACQCAQASGGDLLLLTVQRRSGEDQVQFVSPDSKNMDPALKKAADWIVEQGFAWRPKNDDSQDVAKSDQPSLSIQHVQHGDPATAILKEVAASGSRLLIIPRHQSVKSTSPEFEMERRLFREASCQTMQLRPGDKDRQPCKSIVVAAGGGEHAEAALQFAVELAEANDGSVKAVYVEPKIDPFASFVGERILKRFVSRTLREKADQVESHVVMNNSVLEGLSDARDDGAELLVLGATNHGVVHRLLFSSISEQLLAKRSDVTVCVIRPAMPWTSRICRAIDRATTYYVPQLDRQRRIQLVERVQTSSKWDFDFITLVCLSTMIATFGLIQNSLAVIIGAMLVAPLMTPMLGVGLSLVQGNAVMARNAAGSIWRGFLAAFAIGLLTGLLVPGWQVQTEMANRGSPGVIDLLVAYVSGLCAAYAIGRPHLVSALPGVAIAAALVPPIATSGLAASTGHWDLAIGAALLFLTNFLAIVLGAACSLWSVGIRGAHEHGQFATWAPSFTLALLIATASLAIYEAVPTGQDLKNLRQEIQKCVNDEDDVELVEVVKSRRDKTIQIDVVIRSASEPSNDLKTAILKAAEKRYATAPIVRIEWRKIYSL